MFNRNGGVEVSEADAISTCNRYPAEWTLAPWTRPDGRPDVNIPDAWDQLPAAMRVELARITVNGRGLEIETAEQADAAISEYLAGTQHPTKE
jgi:hypothetical protein